MSCRRHDRGDTIIEVMFAFVIFSLVIVGAILLMNQGVAKAQQSLEITLVRQQIDAQITSIQYMRQHDDAAWSELVKERGTGSGRLVANIPAFGTETCPDDNTLSPDGAFFLARNPSGSGVQAYTITPASYSQDSAEVAFSRVDYAGELSGGTPHAYGLWAYITRAEGEERAGNSAYDFHVRACWGTVGSAVPLTIGTVTRLYDARSRQRLHYYRADAGDGVSVYLDVGDCHGGDSDYAHLQQGVDDSGGESDRSIIERQYQA